jgi:hypothetical protein
VDGLWRCGGSAHKNVYYRSTRRRAHKRMKGA